MHKGSTCKRREEATAARWHFRARPLPSAEKNNARESLLCPGISPAKQTLPAAPALGSCGDLSPWAQWQGHAISACLDTSASSLSTYRVLDKGSDPSISYLLFCFFPQGSESRAEGGSHHAETTTHTPLNLVTLLSQDNIPQSHRLLPAYRCALSVCWHTHCKCAGAGTVLLQTQSLLGAILLSGYRPLWNCRQ